MSLSSQKYGSEIRDPEKTYSGSRIRSTGTKYCLLQADHTYSLIMRLHHNVVKTAVRTISLAYSKITFADIAKKLLLDSPDDAEFIVAKVRFFRVSLKVVKGIFDTVPDRNFARNPLKVLL